MCFLIVNETVVEIQDEKLNVFMQTVDVCNPEAILEAAKGDSICFTRSSSLMHVVTCFLQLLIRSVESTQLWITSQFSSITQV